MRLIWKLTVIVMAAVGVQCLIELGAGPLDEAQFALRAWVAYQRGLPASDPDLVEACHRLTERQMARCDRAWRERVARNAAARVPTTHPVSREKMIPQDRDAQESDPPTLSIPTELAWDDPLDGFD